MNRTLEMAALIILVAINVVGCNKGGANRAVVLGKVTLNGQPMDRGSILFVPIDDAKGAVAGGEIKNGHYELPLDKGPAVGLNRVEIRSSKSTGKEIQYAPGTSAVPEIVQMVASRFNSESTLKIDVQQGENEADYDVQSK